MMLKKKSNTSCDRMISCKATGKVQLELSFKNLEAGNTPEMSTKNVESFRKPDL